MKFRTLSTALIAAALLLMLTGGLVAAQDEDNMNGLLRGTYAYTETLICVRPKADENSLFPPLPQFAEVGPGIYQILYDGETLTMGNSGIVQFDGEGSVTEIGDSLGINHNSVSAGMIPVMPQPGLGCEGDYTVNSDRTVEKTVTCSQEIPGELPLTLTLGPLAYTGYVGADPRNLVLSIANPAISSVTMKAPDESVVTAYEGICASSQVLIRIDSDPTYIAQFGNGTGVLSEVTITNPSTSAAVSGTLQFNDNDGAPMEIGIVGEDAPTSSVDFSVPSLGSTLIATDGQGDDQVGSATATSDSDVGAVVRFTLPGIGITGVGASEAVTGFIVPAQRETGGRSTGLAVFNPGEDPVSVALSLRDPGGVEVATGSIDDLPGQGHVAQFIQEFFEDVPDSFTGTIVGEVTGGRVAA
ncbi:MAG TPA: hypothetical protein VMY18_04905, partial [Acidobacteriota bacterium]|nr:hypothetical protein [Acidobacteriota bacterium]